MSTNWDYAEMAKIAKESGGPKAWLELVKKNSYSEGAMAIRNKYVPYIIVAGVAGIAIGGAVTFTYKKIKNKISLNSEKRRIEAVEAADAEDLLIQVLDENRSSNIDGLDNNLTNKNDKDE